MTGPESLFLRSARKKRSRPRQEGRLVSWNDSRGYGFVQTGDGDRLFVHISALTDRAHRPTRGDRLAFAVSRDDKGRPCATRVSVVSAARRRRLSIPRPPGRYLLAGGFGVLLLLAWALGRLPAGVAVGYIVMGVLTFSLYALDKAAAQSGARRIPESSLHLLALTGGWPGALVAQQRLRHKTRKQPFGAIFWATVIVNIVALSVFVFRGNDLLKWLG